MRFLLLPYLVLAAFFSDAQSGYELSFHIKDLKDTTVYLGFYYGESTFRSDTARSDKDGKFKFSNAKRLQRGVYFLALGKGNQLTKLFDPGILIGEDQHFSMTTNGPDYVRNLRIIGDEDNRLFFENMVFNAESHKEADPFLKVLSDSTLDENQKNKARLAYMEIEKRVRTRQEEIISKHPATLTAKIILMNRKVEVPVAPKRANGTIDSLFQYRYYRQHYFDNFDLTDDAMLRLPSPVYSQKLNEYLDKMFIQSPDTLMAAIQNLALRVKSNKEAYKYLIYSCVYKYQRPAIMGLDEVFVRLYDSYFATGEMDYWVNAAMMKNMKDYANKLRNSLIGKTAANLIMQDQFLHRRELYDLRNTYTLVYFFDPDCGHCKEESPKLVRFYNEKKNHYNLEVFAVSLDTSMQKMRNYIRDMRFTWVTVNGPRSYSGSLFDHYYAETTPMLYVIDNKRKIIAKGLSTDRLDEFLSNYEQFEQKRLAAKRPKN